MLGTHFHLIQYYKEYSGTNIINWHSFSPTESLRLGTLEIVESTSVNQFKNRLDKHLPEEKRL